MIMLISPYPGLNFEVTVSFCPQSSSYLYYCPRASFSKLYDCTKYSFDEMSEDFFNILFDRYQFASE